MQNLHLLLLDLGNDAVFSGVSQDQPLLDRTIQGIVEHHVYAPHCTVAKPRLLALLGFPKSPVLLEILVEFLDVPTGELLQLNFSDSGNDM